MICIEGNMHNILPRSTLINTNGKAVIMAHARIKSANSEFLSLSEAAERCGIGLATARRIASESHAWIILGTRCKRIDFEKMRSYMVEKYGSS